MSKHIKSEINKVLPENRNMQLLYTGTRLGTKFKVKDKTMKEHHHDLTYSVKCLTYSVKKKELMNNGKDINSHIFKHSLEVNHPAWS